MICPLCKKRNRRTALISGKRYLRKFCKSCENKHYKIAYSKPTYRKYKKTTCQFCGFIPINICQLEVDHINGNSKDNRPENLQTLCSNCHTLKTFLNKEGIYRKKRGQK